jgi:hypothetical protein
MTSKAAKPRKTFYNKRFSMEDAQKPRKLDVDYLA